MSREKDGSNLCACHRCWQACGDEDKTLSCEHYSPRSLLHVGSCNVDTEGLVWWNWFDKRETITSVNKTQFKMLTLKKNCSSVWNSLASLLSFFSTSHSHAGTEWRNKSPALTYRFTFSQKQKWDNFPIAFTGLLGVWGVDNVCKNKYMFHKTHKKQLVNL